MHFDSDRDKNKPDNSNIETFMGVDVETITFPMPG